MKHLIVLAILALFPLYAGAQNNNSYEKFKQQREQEKQSLDKKSEQFKIEREKEYEQFKKEYEEEFAQFKRRYLQFIDQEMFVVDLMSSDDGIKVKPLESNDKPKTIVSTANLEKSKLNKEKEKVESLKPEELLAELSDSEDKNEQIKEGLKAIQTINNNMEMAPPTSTTRIKEDPAEEAKTTTNPVPVVMPKKNVKPATETKPVTETKPTAEAKPATETKPAQEVKPATAPETSVPKGKPTNYKRISSPFGPRIHPITHRQSTHKGVDLTASNMTPIYATADGIVAFAKYNGGYGNFIKINHENGYKSAYAHLEQISVNQGEKVHKGQHIGYVGSTGQSTGNHLHYEIYFQDKLIDPAKTL